MRTFKYAGLTLLQDGLDAETIENFSSLPEEEQKAILIRNIDLLLAKCSFRNEDKLAESLLFFASFWDYPGDFSSAGFALINGTSGMSRSAVNGYLVMALFYDSWMHGKLNPDCEKSMTKVCAVLGEGALLERIMRGGDLDYRLGGARVLFLNALRYAHCAPRTEETAGILMRIGRAFLHREISDARRWSL